MRTEPWKDTVHLPGSKLRVQILSAARVHQRSANYGVKKEVRSLEGQQDQWRGEERADDKGRAKVPLVSAVHTCSAHRQTGRAPG